MNPDTNKFEPLEEDAKKMAQKIKDIKGKLTDYHVGLLRPDGSPVPKHWSVFTVGELVTIKDYTFKVVYIGEGNILFEPVGLELPRPSKTARRE